MQTLVDISGVAELNAGIALNQVAQLPEDVQKLDVYAHLQAKHATAPATGCGSSSSFSSFFSFFSSSAAAAAAPKSQGSGVLSPPDLRYFLRISANTTIQSLIDYLSRGGAAQAGAAMVGRAMVMHLKRIAGRQVRNAASIAGSLCMSRYWNFPGDTSVIHNNHNNRATNMQCTRTQQHDALHRRNSPSRFPFTPLCLFVLGLPLRLFFVFVLFFVLWCCSWVVLEGMQASVQVSLPSSQSTVSMELSQLRQLNEAFLIHCIFLPLWLDPAPNSNAFFASARVAQRLQNAHPLVNGTTTHKKKQYRP